MITARVLVSYGSHGMVHTPDGIIPCQWRRGRGRPLCGDHVRISLTQAGTAALEAIEVRDSEFRRGDARGHPQLIAANVEQVVVVVAPKPSPSNYMVDRYLVAIAAMQLTPLIVVNKCDYLDHDPGLLERLEEYQRLGIDVIQTSVKRDPPGIAALREALHDRVSILVGQSGVGKSSLINALIPDREEQTGALSKATGKGRHTTTRTVWIALAEGGAVIDSPGVWEYGLWQMDPGTIAQCFSDFLPHLGHCRFRDCNHRQEPGCALRQAISDGALSPRRLAAYHNIIDLQN